MKYCPFCGAAIIGGAVPFCAECGKPLPRSTKAPHPAQKRVQPTGSSRPSQHKKNKRPPELPPKRKKSQPHSKNASKKPPERKPDPRDEGYDGYYDDIEPIDNGHTRDKMNPELMKRIVIMAAGALLIITLSVILMYLL